ncbi:hypothetical protein ACJIZ3_023163 [Penstemon smallii]|uniref:Ubiquitin-like domain-containing protein n=1 Tax=Penstemon smallii TaxID=265156 RepID=A0ABD3TP93_9LAMI
MGSNDCGPMKISGNDADECSAATVEIKIKTLDSETFTLRVNKCVPVPELKEQIASVTGVLSERQRLICRGKVLKDDQLLSAYHVEDGHTLHLVVRQPVTPSPEASSDQPASDPASSTDNYPGNSASPSMMVGTFNISEQGDGSFPDLNRIISAVINSFGMGRPGSGSEGTDLNQTPSERLSTAFTLGVGGQAASTAVPVESAQPPIIADSLTTLLQYLGHLREEMIVNVRREIPSFLASEGQDFVPSAVPSTESRRLMTPEFLAEVMSSIRQLLIEQATTSFLPSEDQDLYGESRREMEQILRRLFPGGTFVSGNQNRTPPIQTEPVNRGVRNSQVTAQDVGSSQGAASDEGIFLSSILRQIMPMISENAGAETSTDGANNSGEAQADENPDQGNSSRRRHGSQSQESSKRHRRN